MKQVDIYGRVRHSVLIEGISRRKTALNFGVDRRTVDKMLMFSTPPGYRRSKPIRRPKLDGFTETIDHILEADWSQDSSCFFIESASRTNLYGSLAKLSLLLY